NRLQIITEIESLRTRRCLRIALCQLFGGRNRKEDDMSRSEEQQATEAGMTLRVYRLQSRLRSLPLIPRSERVRKLRDRIANDLVRTARADRCIEKINLM